MRHVCAVCCVCVEKIYNMLYFIVISVLVKVQYYRLLCCIFLVGTGFEFPRIIILKGKNHENQDLFNRHTSSIKLPLFK